MTFKFDTAIRNIFSMNNIIRSLNDEDLIEEWLINGVPDGCVTEYDIKNVYCDYDDDELKKVYEELTHLFAKIVKEATKDGYAMWTYIGQK